MIVEALPFDICEAMARHAERAWPEECCGVITAGGDGALAYVEIPNVAGSEAAGEASTRSVRDGYVMDPKALFKAIEAAESAGGGLRAIVHSHPDVGAYFSAEDRRAALGGGDEPLWPGLDYVVISCRGGRTDDARAYRWDASARAFHERRIDLGAARR